MSFIPKFFTQFTRSSSDIREVSVVNYTFPSKVKSSLGYAVDINTIYDSYCRREKLPLNGLQPIFDSNFVNFNSLVEAQKLVDEAKQYFIALPSDVRAHYGNSLEKFVKAVHSNDDYLVKSGVVKFSSDKSVFNPSLNGPTVEPSLDGSSVVTPDVQPPVSEATA